MLPLPLKYCVWNAAVCVYNVIQMDGKENKKDGITKCVLWK